MAREETLVHELSQRQPPQRAVIETTAYDATKDIILLVLREMFSRHPEYTYVPDPERGFDFPDVDKTRLQIWQDYPYDTLFLPVITINMGSLRDHPIGFNQNINTVDYKHDENGNLEYNQFGQPIPLYFEYSGAWDISFSININAQSPWDRDIIADFVTINMMHVYRDWLYTRGVHVKTCSTSGESQVDWRNQHVYKLTLSLDLYTEWTHRIPYPIELLERISITQNLPISTQPLVPPGGIDTNYHKVEDVATIIADGSPLQSVDRFLDMKPLTAMDTISYNSALNEWEIKESWWDFIARTFSSVESLQMLSALYGINTLSEITVENWFDILARISSPAHLGYLKTIQDVHVGTTIAAAVLNVDIDDTFPDGSEETSLNRLIQLRNIETLLRNNYMASVTRPRIGQP